MTRAYEQLRSNGRKARGTESTAAGNRAGTADSAPQSQTDYAAELFDRACSTEVGGDPLEAMKLFAAAVRVDSQLRYVRRAAACALAAKQPKSALEYAKKAAGIAPEDPSCQRLLAQCFRAANQLDAAEEVLVMPMALKSENDVLALELRNDLAAVRRLIAARSR